MRDRLRPDVLADKIGDRIEKAMLRANPRGGGVLIGLQDAADIEYWLRRAAHPSNTPTQVEGT